MVEPGSRARESLLGSRPGPGFEGGRSRGGPGASTMMDITAARAALAAQRAAWSHEQTEFQNWRPTPTRAETTAIAAGDPLLFKDLDGSPVAVDALDALDPSVPPVAPAEIPIVLGLPVCGHELHASPGKITPRRYFRWLRDGVEIPNANALRYTLTSDDIGHRISFAVTRARMVARAREVGPVRTTPLALIRGPHRDPRTAVCLRRPPNARTTPKAASGPL